MAHRMRPTGRKPTAPSAGSVSAYNEDTGQLRCVKCGEWRNWKGLTQHLNSCAPEEPKDLPPLSAAEVLSAVHKEQSRRELLTRRFVRLCRPSEETQHQEEQHRRSGAPAPAAPLHRAT